MELLNELNWKAHLVFTKSYIFSFNIIYIYEVIWGRDFVGNTKINKFWYSSHICNQGHGKYWIPY